MEEIWKDIKNYEGFYQVSSLGRIRSLDRTICQKSKYGTTMIKKYKGKIIAPQTQQSKYYVVYLIKQRERRRLYVHKLVADAFIPNPLNKKEINHKDCDKYNNNVTNLEWVTRKENLEHAVRSGLTGKQRNYCISATGEKYIGIRNGKYRLNFNWNNIRHDRCYNTLEEAIKKRDELLNVEKHPAA